MSPQPNHEDAAASLRSAISEGDVEAVLNLLDGGADVDAFDDEDKTPLHHAASDGQNEIVELLLGRGADIDANNRDVTPLFLAAVEGQTETVRVLLDFGADTEWGRDGTPLYFAIMEGSGGIVLALLEHGAEITEEIVENLLFERKDAISHDEMYSVFYEDGLRRNAMETGGWVGDFRLVENIIWALLTRAC